MVRWYETCTFCRTTGKSPNPYPLLPMEMSMTRHFRWCELYKHGDCIMWCSTVDLLNCPIPLLRIPPYPALQVWLPARMTICLHLPEHESHPVMSNSLRPRGLYSPWNSPGQHTGVGRLSLFQGIFPTQGSNPGVLHCRLIFFFTGWAIREAQEYWSVYPIPSPGNLPNPGIEPGSPALQVDPLTTELWGKPWTSPNLVHKISCSGKLLSPRQPGQLVYLSCSHVLVCEPPLGPWLTQPMVLDVVKLDRSPSLLLGFWMLNWEKFTRRLGVVLQQLY